MTERHQRGLAWVVAVALTVLIGQGLVLAAGAQPVQPPAQQEFVPVDQLPQPEPIPAAPLVIGAYAFVWVAVLGYVWSVKRRLGRVERELADVARRVASPGRRS